MDPSFISYFFIFILLVLVFVICIFCFCDDSKKSGKTSKFKRPKSIKYKFGSSLDGRDIVYGDNIEEVGNNYKGDDDGGGYEYEGGGDGGCCDYSGGDVDGGCDFGGGDGVGGDCGGE